MLLIIFPMLLIIFTKIDVVFWATDYETHVSGAARGVSHRKNDASIRDLLAAK